MLAASQFTCALWVGVVLLFHMASYNQNSATNTLKRFFAQSPESDEVTLQDIWRATGRTHYDEPANLAWLYNKMSLLRYYNLIDTKYKMDGRKKIDRLALTLEGKRILGRVTGGDKSQAPVGRPSSRVVTLQAIAEDIDEFMRQNPSIRLDLDIKLASKEAQMIKEKG